ncbi:asparagine synthase-related protein [Terribacillus sp. AE2B 122]|uniref:asparagine synthase-related protein n=1 Tax=Terribacillus sp. AE2B 122 TaxID=1331902 RepID=UPI0014404AC3|nr:asparagine synthase-related protein [Terribacillus sp. AE2B 122]VVM34050.1 Putative asparagine synthetase(EC:6.3.5.4) [Terribacillus sp. AE2B 122]
MDYIGFVSTHNAYSKRKDTYVDLLEYEVQIQNKTYYVFVSGRIHNHNSKVYKEIQEYIVNKYLQEGLNFLNNIEGSYSIILFDQANNSLILGKDPIGLKPLFYTINGDGVFWYSRISLYTSDHISSLNESYISNFIMKEPSAHSATPYQEVHRIEPGHVVQIKLDSLMISNHKYYKFPQYSIGRKGETELFYEKFSNALKNTFSDIKDEKIGFSLSGGLDSNSIYNLAIHLGLIAPENAYTYSLTYSSPMANEDRYIEQALHLNKPKHSQFINGDDLWSFKGGIEKISIYDEPYPFLTHQLASKIPEALQKDKIRYVISGHAGDHVLQSQLGVFREMIRKKQLTQFVYHFLYVTLTTGIKNAFYSEYWMKTQFKKDIPWIKANSHVENDFTSIPYGTDAASKESYFNAIVYQNGHEWIAPYIYGRNNIEIRYPFLDLKLIEYLLNLSPFSKMDYQFDKLLLRKSLKNVLPEGIRTRNNKSTNGHLIIKGFQQEWENITDFWDLELVNEFVQVDNKLFKESVQKFYHGIVSDLSNVSSIGRALALEAWLRKRLC